MEVKKTKLKNGSLRYRVRVSVNGERITKTFRSLEAARSWGVQQESFLLSGGDTVRRQARMMTFADLADKYLMVEGCRFARTSQQAMKGQYKIWERLLGGAPLNQVTPERIREGIRILEAEGRSPDTVNAYLTALSTVFRYAERVLRCVERNPCEFVRRVRAVKRDNLRPLHRWLTREEIDALLRACRESSCAALYPAVVVTISTVARLKEVRMLPWSAVDFERKRILYSERRVQRDISLCGEALEVMQRLYMARRPGAVYCFPSPAENRPIDFRHSWEEAVKRAGLAGLQPSDLQATAVDLLYRGGVPLEKLALFIGVKSAVAVLRLLSPAVSTERAAGLAGQVSEALFPASGAERPGETDTP